MTDVPIKMWEKEKETTKQLLKVDFSTATNTIHLHTSI